MRAALHADWLGYVLRDWHQVITTASSFECFLHPTFSFDPGTDEAQDVKGEVEIQMHTAVIPRGEGSRRMSTPMSYAFLA